MADRCPKQYKHDRRLLELLWRTKAPLAPMLCQPGAPISTRHGSMLVRELAQTKASLVLMVSEIGVLEAQGCA